MAKSVFLVGSCERKFVVDQAYLDEDEAIRCCDSRRNKTLAWSVIELPIGEPWINSRVVHRTERSE